MFLLILLFCVAGGSPPKRRHGTPHGAPTAAIRRPQATRPARSSPHGRRDIRRRSIPPLPVSRCNSCNVRTGRSLMWVMTNPLRTRARAAGRPDGRRSPARRPGFQSSRHRAAPASAKRPPSVSRHIGVLPWPAVPFFQPYYAGRPRFVSPTRLFLPTISPDRWVGASRSAPGASRGDRSSTPSMAAITSPPLRTPASEAAPPSSTEAT